MDLYMYEQVDASAIYEKAFTYMWILVAPYSMRRGLDKWEYMKAFDGMHGAFVTKDEEEAKRVAHILQLTIEPNCTFDVENAPPMRLATRNT